MNRINTETHVDETSLFNAATGYRYLSNNTQTENIKKTITQLYPQLYIIFGGIWNI